MAKRPNKIVEGLRAALRHASGDSSAAKITTVKIKGERAVCFEGGKPPRIVRIRGRK